MKFCLRKIKVPFLAIGAVGIFLLNPVDADAASFNHVHGDACYSVVTGTCKDHVTEIDHCTEVYHCTECLKQTTHNVTVYWDVCKNGYQKRRDVGYVITCSVCGHKRTDNPAGRSSEYYHTYKKKKLICEKAETDSAADVSLHSSASGYTNATVTLSADVKINEEGFALDPLPYDFGQGYTDCPSFEVSENGTYTLNVKDSTGRVVSTSVTVDSIDKLPPYITAITKDTEEWSEKGVVITVDAGDGESGLAENAYSFNGGEFNASNSYNVKKNGTVTIKVRDKAGNVCEDSIEIKNVGKDPAVIAREKAEEEARKKAEEAAKRAEEERIMKEKEAIERAEREAIEKAEKEAEEKAAAEKAAKEESEKAKKEALEKAEAEKKRIEEENRQKLKAEKQKARDSFLEKKRKMNSNDVSGADASAGNGSDSGKGGMISVKDMTESSINPDGSTESLQPLDSDVIESLSELDNAENVERMTFAKASVGNLTLKAGIVLLVLSAVFFSFFNYIYVSENGHAKPVSLCKVVKSKDGKEITVSVKKKRMRERGRYCIYFCPWNRIGLKKKDVKVVIEGEDKPIPTDERTTFMY